MAFCSTINPSERGAVSLPRVCRRDAYDGEKYKILVGGSTEEVVISRCNISTGDECRYTGGRSLG
ncbi:MAG: hypothetical protein ACLSB7_04870 [Parabacteroides distasonis]